MTMTLSLQRLQHQPAAQAIGFAFLMLVAAAAGFRMGSPHGLVTSGTQQWQSFTQDQPPLSQTSTSAQNIAQHSQSAAYALTTADSSQSSFTSSAAAVSSVAPLSNSALVNNASAAVPFTTGAAYSSPTASATPVAAPAAPPQIKLPLVFSNVNLAALNLTAQEVAGIDRLRTSFTKAVGQQTPNDPQYAERWADAQPTTDDKLRSLLGWGRFNSYLLQATRTN